MIELGLPETINVDGIERAIYTDFRDIIPILIAYNDPDLDENDRTFILLNNLYVDNFEEFNDTKDALIKGIEFLDCGKKYKPEEPQPRLMDWEQDYQLLTSPINRVAGHEVRYDEYVHWWTYFGWYREMGECLYSTVVTIRQKLLKNRKLDDFEKEFLRDNRDLVILKDRFSAEEQEEINEIFGW